MLPMLKGGQMTLMGMLKQQEIVGRYEEYGDSGWLRGLD